MVKRGCIFQLGRWFDETCANREASKRWFCRRQIDGEMIRFSKAKWENGLILVRKCFFLGWKVRFKRGTWRDFIQNLMQFLHFLIFYFIFKFRNENVQKISHFFMKFNI